MRLLWKQDRLLLFPNAKAAIRCFQRAFAEAAAGKKDASADAGKSAKTATQKGSGSGKQGRSGNAAETTMRKDVGSSDKQDAAKYSDSAKSAPECKHLGSPKQLKSDKATATRGGSSSLKQNSSSDKLKKPEAETSKSSSPTGDDGLKKANESNSSRRKRRRKKKSLTGEDASSKQTDSLKKPSKPETASPTEQKGEGTSSGQNSSSKKPSTSKAAASTGKATENVSLEQSSKELSKPEAGKTSGSSLSERRGGSKNRRKPEAVSPTGKKNVSTSKESVSLKKPNEPSSSKNQSGKMKKSSQSEAMSPTESKQSGDSKSEVGKKSKSTSSSQQSCKMKKPGDSTSSKTSSPTGNISKNASTKQSDGLKKAIKPEAKGSSSQQTKMQIPTKPEALRPTEKTSKDTSSGQPGAETVSSAGKMKQISSKEPSKPEVVSSVGKLSESCKTKKPREGMSPVARMAEEGNSRKRRSPMRVPFQKKFIRSVQDTTGFVWAAPTTDDLEELNLNPREYWFRIWFMRYCGAVKKYERGKQFHETLLKDTDRHVLIGTQLIDMYGKCRKIEEAYAVFDKIEKKSIITWNFMLGALARQSKDDFCEGFWRSWDYGWEAVKLFKRMLKEGVEPNAVSFTHAVNACGSIRYLSMGQRLHKMASKSGYDRTDTILGNSLVTMYYRCARMALACTTFESIERKNVMSWTHMVVACNRMGQRQEALNYHHMMQLDGVKQDRASLVAGIDACANADDEAYGKVLHSQACSMGLEVDVIVGTAIVHMYGLCGNVEMATREFSRLKEKNIYTWNSIIKGYLRSGCFEEALFAYELMRNEGVAPDGFTFTSVLNACEALAAHDYGVKLDHWSRYYYKVRLVMHALCSFYAKCGNFTSAEDTFANVPYKDSESFGIMISAFAQHGQLDKAAEYFHTMNLLGFRPESASVFAALLDGCSYKSKLRDCRIYFRSMIRDFQFEPQIGHFKAVLHLLGRKGLLSKMEDLLKHMPFYPGSEEWLVLLAACEAQNDVERGESAAKEMLKLESRDHLPYEILANIYIQNNNMTKAAEMVEKLRSNKLREFSWIEVHGKVYRFLEGYKKQRLYENLEVFVTRVKVKMAEAAHVFKSTSLDLIRGNVEKERHHSEVLALAYGVLKLNHDQDIRIVCRHRMCSDCHSVIKFVATTMARKIIVRDASLSHHFEDGVCSCRDFW